MCADVGAAALVALGCLVDFPAPSEGGRCGTAVLQLGMVPAVPLSSLPIARASGPALPWVLRGGTGLPGGEPLHVHTWSGAGSGPEGRAEQETHGSEGALVLGDLGSTWLWQLLTEFHSRGPRS